MAIPYSTTGIITGSLISGSFLSAQYSALFMVSQSQDIWFGFSQNDVIEFSVYDPTNNDNLVQWETLQQTKTFTTQSITYLDALNVPHQISYRKLNRTFTLYKNNSLLATPIDNMNEVGITEGSYKLSYVFSRDMAGSPATSLSIKEISPYRTEVKLIPQTVADVQYTAFCLGKFPTRDVAPVLLSITQKCPYDRVYSVMSPLPQYKVGINYLKFIFSLTDDGSVVNFLKNLYEDFIQYTVLSNSQISDGSEPTQVMRIQGIRSYFSNYLVSTYDSITDFNTLESKFSDFVNIRVTQKFGQFSTSVQDANYLAARQFCYDFFFVYYYGTAVHPLQSAHQQKYFSPFKNVLNFGNNRYFSVLNNGNLDERSVDSDPLTLILKLASPLPNDIAPKDSCWVSNFAMTPFVVTVNLQNPVKYQTIRISAPNFGSPTQFITKENVNKLYSSDDLTLPPNTEDSIRVGKNTVILNTDYSDFSNFVLFSSADARLTLFENKIKTWASISASLDILNQKYLTSLSSSTVYAYYATEKDTAVAEMSSIINSFDGYESYLFNSGNYIYSTTSGSFVSASYVVDQHAAARLYDINNADNLIANTPEYILNDSNNQDYITFLMMAGHHFDNIYVYISALPIERQVHNEISSSLPTSTLKQMLSSFGWDVDDIINSLNVDEVYLNSMNGTSYDVLSGEQRLQIIWNRILVNLPGIYKSKGTEECVRFLLSCYGLPSSLISIREYGGTDFSADTQPTYTLDEKTFMTVFSGISDYIEGPMPKAVQSVEFKFTVEHPELYLDRKYYPLFSSIPYPYTSPKQSAWSVGLVKVPGQYSGQIEFRMLSGSTGVSVTSSVLPVFNGVAFSVMLRRESPDDGFEFTLNTDEIPSQYDLVVQRNEDGRKVFYSTSSAVFLYKDNSTFSQFGRFRFGNGEPGGSFIGTLDKLSIWTIPLDDADFDEHVNDINSYGYSGSYAYQDLWVKLGVDYPLDLYNNLSGSSSVWVDNQSLYYAIPDYYIGGLSGSIDKNLYSASLDIIQTRWVPNYPFGSVEIIARNFPPAVESNYTTSFNTSTCRWDSGSIYPFHYRELVYQQNLNASKFGPNKFKNKKIRKVDYEVEARFDSDDKSANIINQTISGESNQIGFFVDPQDSKNKDIIRYVGRNGIMDLIANPADMYSDKYYNLINRNYEYSTLGNKRTYFNELLTVYKFYFDKSIFEAIKNILPARANIFTGVVIEPTILERPKYQNRPITSSIVLSYEDPVVLTPIENFSAQGLWMNFNDDFSGMTSQSQAIIKASAPLSYMAEVDFSYLSDPVRDYPENLGFNFFKDTLDPFQHSLYADFENLPRLWELEGAPLAWPTDPIKGSVSAGKADDRLMVGADQNSVVRTSDPTSTGYNQTSHSIIYYMMKMWQRYDYFGKTGPYFHTDIPAQNSYSSGSVYLYKYVVVTEPFMRQYVYWYNLTDTLAPNTDPSYTFNINSYLHRSSTFKNTPDQRVSNVYATNFTPNPVVFSTAFRPDRIYFEIVHGYPVNHYTHKMTQFSKSQCAMFLEMGENTSFTKGKNTIDTTVNESGINDGSPPVQYFSTNNVNIVNATSGVTATNVIQPGGSSNAGAIVPSNTSTSP